MECGTFAMLSPKLQPCVSCVIAHGSCLHLYLRTKVYSLVSSPVYSALAHRGVFSGLSMG